MSITNEIPHMRSIRQLVYEIKQYDPNSVISEKFLRKLILEKKIPSVMSGRKYFVSREDLIEYLSNSKGSKGDDTDISNVIGIRKVKTYGIKQ